MNNWTYIFCNAMNECFFGEITFIRYTILWKYELCPVSIIRLNEIFCKYWIKNFNPVLILISISECSFIRNFFRYVNGLLVATETFYCYLNDTVSSLCESSKIPLKVFLSFWKLNFCTSYNNPFFFLTYIVEVSCYYHEI